MVSHQGFRRFVTYIGQGNISAKDIPDRHTVALKAQSLSEEAKVQIKNEMKVTLVLFFGGYNCLTILKC